MGHVRKSRCAHIISTSAIGISLLLPQEPFAVRSVRPSHTISNCYKLFATQSAGQLLSERSARQGIPTIAPCVCPDRQVGGITCTLSCKGCAGDCGADRR